MTCCLGALCFTVFIKAGYTGILHFSAYQLKWVAALEVRTMDYKWQSNHCVCSAHFHGGRRYGTNNIPAAFPQKDKRTGQIVWPVDVSYLLNADVTEATVSSSDKTENADVVCPSCKQVETYASDQQSEDTRRKNIAKNDSHSEELFLEKACDCQIEIDQRRGRKIWCANVYDQ